MPVDAKECGANHALLLSVETAGSSTLCWTAPRTLQSCFKFLLSCELSQVTLFLLLSAHLPPKTFSRTSHRHEPLGPSLKLTSSCCLLGVYLSVYFAGRGQGISRILPLLQFTSAKIIALRLPYYLLAARPLTVKTRHCIYAITSPPVNLRNISY